MNKNICQNCKKRLKKDSLYCENCGTKVSNEVQEKPKTNSFALFDNKRFLVAFSVIITLIICMGLGTVFYNVYLKDDINETVKVEKDVTVTDKGIADAVEKVYDSVVVVQNYRNGQLYSTGTGFVFKKADNNGYILTNNHVIENGDEVRVMFTDGTIETVKVVGSDAYSDIAVLSVDEKSIISVAELGETESIRVGDTTFAVGAPLDSEIYSWTVTRGILSGKNRAVQVSSSNSSSAIMEVMQTDTAINAGNSGGPLCNSNGQVIGITNMKISSSSVEGMGFAIPIETALEYANMFIDGTVIQRPYLGVSMYDLSNSFFSNQTGVYIESVENDSPAEKAGLQKGDIIIGFNDEDVTNSAYLKYKLYKCNIGDEITLTIKRNNKEESVKVTLGSYNITT